MNFFISLADALPFGGLNTNILSGLQKYFRV